MKLYYGTGFISYEVYAEDEKDLKEQINEIVEHDGVKLVSIDIDYIEADDHEWDEADRKNDERWADGI